LLTLFQSQLNIFFFQILKNKKMNIAATPNVPSPNSPSANNSQFMMASSNFSSTNNQGNIQNASVFNPNTSSFNSAINFPIATSSSPPPPSSPSQTFSHHSPVSPPPSTLPSPGKFLLSF